MAANPQSPAVGPPWIGPITTRRGYERQWLMIAAVMLVAATILFGWRALFMVCLTASVALVAHTLAALALRLIRGQWPTLSITSATFLGLMTGLTMPLLPQPWLALAAGVLAGVLSQFTGPTHRLRVHPVALVQLILLFAIPLTGRVGLEAVLAKTDVVIGDVHAATTPAGGPTWLSMRVPAAADAIQRPSPSRVILEEQRRILNHGSRLVVLLKEGELPRLSDVVIGAVPGPVGATSAGLMILLGVVLIYRRIGSWHVAVTAIAAAVVMLVVLPVDRPEGVTMSFFAMSELGWRATVGYLSYQILASPLLLIVLILAPMTMPRCGGGRVIYAVLIGTGVVLLPWLIPHEGVHYLALVVAGLMTPVLDQFRSSPFVALGRA